MPAYKVLPAYENLNPKTPKPADGGVPYFITAQEGVPVIYSEDTIPTCGIRLLHPSNVNAPSKGLALSILFVPPMSKMEIYAEFEAKLPGPLKSSLFAFGRKRLLGQDG